MSEGTPEYSLRVLDLAADRDRTIEQLRRAETAHREFVEGLTRALSEHGVPAMPSWRAAIDWLAVHGGGDVTMGEVERWVLPEDALDGCVPGNVWPVRRADSSDPTFTDEVEVVRATDYEGAAEERDELRAELARERQRHEREVQTWHDKLEAAELLAGGQS